MSNAWFEDNPFFWPTFNNAAKTALVKTADWMRGEARKAQVIPFGDTGLLKGEAFQLDTSGASKGEVYVVHSTPYARRLYFHPEYNFRTDRNPNAQGLWLRHWMDGGEKRDQVLNAYAAFLKRGL